VAGSTDTSGRFCVERNDNSSPRTLNINRGDSIAPPRSHRRLDGSELPPTRQLYVANLLYDVTKDDLKAEMEEFGEVVSSRIIMQNDVSRGFVLPLYPFVSITGGTLNNPIIIYLGMATSNSKSWMMLYALVLN
jgi:RNA recognition motif. (a.k.a. RRM, RBD, or RNP domain)